MDLSGLWLLAVPPGAYCVARFPCRILSRRILAPVGGWQAVAAGAFKCRVATPSVLVLPQYCGDADCTSRRSGASDFSDLDDVDCVAENWGDGECDPTQH